MNVGDLCWVRAMDCLIFPERRYKKIAVREKLAAPRIVSGRPDGDAANLRDRKQKGHEQASGHFPSPSNGSGAGLQAGHGALPQPGVPLVATLPEAVAAADQPGSCSAWLDGGNSTPARDPSPGKPGRPRRTHTRDRAP